MVPPLSELREDCAADHGGRHGGVGHPPWGEFQVATATTAAIAAIAATADAAAAVQLGDGALDALPPRRRLRLCRRPHDERLARRRDLERATAVVAHLFYL